MPKTKATPSSRSASKKRFRTLVARTLTDTAPTPARTVRRRAASVSVSRSGSSSRRGRSAVTTLARALNSVSTVLITSTVTRTTTASVIQAGNAASTSRT
jgi:sirohydrochlorin ferrochelatase